jgi:hypothetical protein
MGRTPITPTTPVAVVNGTDVLYTVWTQRVQTEIQSAQERNGGRSLSQDDTRRIENSVFDQMVSEVLLQQEYARRGIFATDDEIREYARYAPPPWVMQAPELQTEGRFDPEKYSRLLASPQARQGQLLVQLEQYYRSEIPRQKLFDQIASGAYVADAELWRIWRDRQRPSELRRISCQERFGAHQVGLGRGRPCVPREAQDGIRASGSRGAVRHHHPQGHHGGRHGGSPRTRGKAPR